LEKAIHTIATLPTTVRVKGSISSPQTFSTRKIATAQLYSSSSGINELPNIVQALVFFASYIGLGTGTFVGVNTFDIISKDVLGLEKWRNNIIDDPKLPSIFGFFYTMAGISHFTNPQGFQNIYPPQGTWGIWYIPGSPAFHVAWTGILEILAGSGLLYSAYLNYFENSQSNRVNDDEESLVLKLIKPISALILFGLTVLVTPANIYMFTHGKTLEPGGDPLNLQYHVIRFIIQIIILSLLLTIAKDSFVFAWADELE
jgi:uncharacterized membrane protein